MVLDNGQCFEGFAQADTVRDDAAAKTVELVDGADHAVTLELVELLPHDGVADAGGGFDDSLFIQPVTRGREEVMQEQRVEAVRIALVEQ